MEDSLNNVRSTMISVINDMEQIIDSMQKIRGVTQRTRVTTRQKDFSKMKCSSLYKHFDKQLKHVISIGND